MNMDVLLLLLGLVLLFAGGDALVRGAGTVARQLGISPQLHRSTAPVEVEPGSLPGLDADAREQAARVGDRLLGLSIFV